jgi:hypothetical protein
LLRTRDAEREWQRRSALEAEKEAASQAAEASRRENEERAERDRLESLRKYGRAFAVLSPPEYQAKVARDLLATVTAEEYPGELPVHVAYAQISARVDQILKPWRDAQDKERAQAEDQRKVLTLLQAGRWHALTETTHLDAKSRERAQREVEQALKEEVDSAWTVEEVKDFVEEIVDEWDDD